MRKICDSSRCVCSSWFSARALSRSVPNGFSTMTRRQPCGSRSLDQPGRAELLDDGAVDASAESPGRTARRRAAHLRQLGRAAAGTGRDRPSLPGRSRCRARAPSRRRRASRGRRTPSRLSWNCCRNCIVGHRRPGDADDGEPRRQALAARQLVERRQQLAPREIAGRAEDDERGRLGSGLDA